MPALADFRNVVSILLGEYEDHLKVNRRPRDTMIFRTFVSSVVTQARRGVETTLQNIEKDNNFKGWSPIAFATPEGEKLLKKYVGHKSKINKILEQSKRMADQGLKEWIEDLRNDKISIGQKTKDDFLKEIGLLEYFPIDRYYPPFLARTGFLYKYLDEKKLDPGPFMRGLGDGDCYNAYKGMMIDLCKRELKGLKHNGLDLSDNPGIVDMIIWRHCAAEDSEAFEICGKSPRCSECKIKALCNYGANYST